jgi:hypothetical protein
MPLKSWDGDKTKALTTGYALIHGALVGAKMDSSELHLDSAVLIKLSMDASLIFHHLKSS